MEYRELKPAGALNRYIQCFWMLEDPAPSAEAQRIVPDGRPELIFNLGQSFESEGAGGWQRQPQSFVAGQITRPLLIRARGPAKIVGIRFHPHGACRVLGVPLHELTDSVVTLDAISADLHRRMQRIGELSEAGDGQTADCLATLATLMAEMAQEGDGEGQQISAAVAAFESTAGAAEVAEVADHVGLSPRQLQRRFREAVGISPKLFSRMQRFQRVFQAMEAQALDWVDTAIECGYYDQAHLIRDFREFSGKAPTALLAGEIDLARHFSRPAQR
jgi:AraC-like DNA-binding protein